MQSQPIPKRRWQYVSTDLFTIKKDTYVIVVDNLTKYWDIEELTELSALNTVLQTKKILSRHGVPEFVISDNGPSIQVVNMGSFRMNGTSSIILHHHITQRGMEQPR
jgi:hypothetical protein